MMFISESKIGFFGLELYLYGGFLMNKFLYGADYNPEQWKKYPDILKKDIELMKKAGCNVMSVGIFAWSEIEKEEGRFDFSFFDSVLKNLNDNGIKVIFATPSGARPAWMSKKYPEILRTDEYGIRHTHGGRHNHCFTSPVYREKVKIMNTQLAEHFADNPVVIGWHVSNEYGGECHCELCKEEFRKWLKNKYKTLDKLNEQWWSSFWSHTYTEWKEIDPPSEIGENGLHGLNLDWKRFVTYQTLDFYKAEIKPLREITPDKFVTTNFHGAPGHLDYWKFKDYVDIISWDAYPEWKGDKSDFDTMINASFIYDICRSFKKAPFLLMESTPSNVNWREYAKLKEKGMNILSSMQAVACGADSVQYFQWRKSRGSCEKFHGAVVDHVGHEDTRVFKEVSKFGEILSQISHISGTISKSTAAVIFDCENSWALEDSKGFKNISKGYEQECIRHYKQFIRKGISVDVIDSEQDFSQYSILAAPMLYMLKPDVSRRLKDFVNNGGTLISTYITGYVNENDLCFLGGFPGDGMMELFGIWNEEIDTLYPSQTRIVKYGNKKYNAKEYIENIHIVTAKSLGTFENGMFTDNPAVTVNEYGAGKAYYITFRSDEDFLDDFYDGIMKDGDVFGGGIYIKKREDSEKIYYFIQNYRNEDKEIVLKKEYVNEFNGKKESRSIKIGAYQTIILSERK